MYKHLCNNKVVSFSKFISNVYHYIFNTSIILIRYTEFKVRVVFLEVAYP